jgi:hypothetical protein
MRSARGGFLGDSEGVDLVSQSVAMDAEGACGLRHVAVVVLNRREEELALELATRLGECEASANELVDHASQLSVEVVLLHVIESWERWTKVPWAAALDKDSTPCGPRPCGVSLADDAVTDEDRAP